MTKFKIGQKVKVISKSIASDYFDNFKEKHPNMIAEIVEYSKGRYFLVKDERWSFLEQDLEPINEKPVKVGDIIVDKVGYESMVLEVFENTFIASVWNNFDVVGGTCHFKEIEANGWKVKIYEKEDIIRQAEAKEQEAKELRDKASKIKEE